ncbi:elongation factor P hydroxylase [Halioxenophilus sp. WMMB6]|uniref:elongation factor P hydroxylase n=1 Tax=Halioxenophilus sp. WMMB6 TaxID=3073815 RepID=UPI00295F338C|nr:elongation factor P hydroxylase [Halioxenophilus sp. WMMB6]
MNTIHKIGPSIYNAPASDNEPSAQLMNRVPSHDALLLQRLFNQCFAESENTLLQGEASEPLYQPGKNPGAPHTIFFTQDYFASALHEVAHWCVAGPERRQRLDYGYWYAPDGRNEQQQRLFEQVEVKPQAMEWLFSRACQFRFRVSADNLQSGFAASDDFKQAISEQVQNYLAQGLPARAQRFLDCLATEFGGDYCSADYTWTNL